VANLEDINSKLEYKNSNLQLTSEKLKNTINIKKLDLKKDLQTVKLLNKRIYLLNRNIEFYQKKLNYKPYFTEEDNEYFEGKEKKLKEYLTYLDEGKEAKYKYYGSGKEFYKMKILAEKFYSPLKSRMFDAKITNGGTVKLFYNRESLKYYGDLLKEISHIYASVDVESLSEKEIIKAFSRKISSEFTYDDELGSEEDFFNASPFGVIDEEKSIVCTGYTYIMQMLLDMAHIKNTTVLGYLEESNTGHVWNEVTLSNGEVYYIDVTWADFEKAGVYMEKYVLSKDIDFNDNQRSEILKSTIQNFEEIESFFFERDNNLNL
jgi:hypothetical protein